MSLLARSVAIKLTLAFLTVAVSTAWLVYFLVNRDANNTNVHAQFAQENVARVAGELEAYYAERGKWDGIEREMRRFEPDASTIPLGFPPLMTDGSRGNDPSAPNNPGAGGPPPNGGGPFLMVDANRRTLLPSFPYRQGDTVPPSIVALGTPLMLDGQVIGTLLPISSAALRDLALEEGYVARTNQLLLRAMAGATLFAAGLSILLAQLFLRPIRDLTGAAAAVARGDLSQRVPVRSRDEFGSLARTFNQMSADLARANQLRRQMTADIAHDLRTPLQVIAGYVEAMRDRVLQPTPDRLETIYSEIGLLERLISDLFMLAKADAGELPLHPQPLAPAQLLARVERAFGNQASQQGVQLQVEVPRSLPPLHGDEERLVQVLSNLVANALRHTPSGGQIELRARQVGDHIALSVSDTGQGIPPTALPHLFERFYRVDKSRKGEGTGLGLAIAKSLVEAHGGTIAADSLGPGKGATFTLSLPAGA